MFTAAEPTVNTLENFWGNKKKKKKEICAKQFLGSAEQLPRILTP